MIFHRILKNPPKDIRRVYFQLKTCNNSIQNDFLGFIWNEIKQLWDVGLKEYLNDMWNVVDFTTNSLYVATVSLRLVAYYRVQVREL